ncbi:LysR family transcriptional regulator [Rhizobium oryzihabitans]|jgi:DNA-binding transcriptional LysR family regulator|uniref:HTH-type transcriptional regulator TtuA n=1 Tax=Rhizobium oryzihabitans TaxID=2267833 RepID=A0A7L5BKW1_9HYPH|nr:MULTISPECIES: LysR family transcriptional regulator [Rhizobium]EGP58459.1 Transcriptional regulator, LysR family [Agrobacterium tumefaciens F2]MCW0983076.1 LysR family transcriptional regulator [Agrobacterium sp. BT-220-3]QCM06596.1 LysR family transcriptional regulator [Agrobacterium tumefaciens]CUX37825.1 Transcriptional regulator, LysR family [Agrobacterium genomosp. 5 str. CFBP 6626]QIB39492.1 LysR family transcriptional regulator [Rhizobium oryzihabitans]
MKIDLNLLPLFLAVAEEHNFRAAADRLGVTRSAVSQGMRRLEDALGTALVMRTTRSVRLTEAGEQLFEAVSRPLCDLGTALEDIATENAPRGLLRIAATSIAETFLSGPFIASFAAAYPGVTIDVTVTDEEFDIVAAGYDAGIRLGEVIEQDMIAIPLTREQREMVVASPAYLAAHGAPAHPRDLVHHRCIGWRPAPNVAPYRWEFEENGVPFDVAVEPQITTNDLRLMLRAALAGGGITFALEETFLPFVENGKLVPLLEDFLPPFPGFFVYFPQRRNMAPKMRALIKHVQDSR